MALPICSRRTVQSLAQRIFCCGGMAHRSRVVVAISPHLDDAVLSCGATLWALAQLGWTCWVLTLFAGAPSVRSSENARAFHAACGLGDFPLSTRRAEDINAARLIGATPVHWDFLDAIYRVGVGGEPLYPTFESLFANPSADDVVLGTAIRAQLQTSVIIRQADILLAPAAIGGHVDHILARDAATMGWFQHGRRPALYMYEDLPYGLTTEHCAKVERTMTGAGRSTVVGLPHRAMKAKLAAVCQYRSQVRMLWREHVQGLGLLRSHAHMLAPPMYGEQFWASKAVQNAEWRTRRSRVFVNLTKTLRR